MVHSTQTMDLSCIKVSTISKRTELSFHLNHGPISEPIVCLAQTVLLSCTDSNTVCKWTKMRFHMTHVPFLCVQNDFRACGMFSAYEISTFSKRVPSGASKMNSQPMVCLVQTVHLSCTDTNTISKQTETRF
jgi:hypothetical protein